MHRPLGERVDVELVDVDVGVLEGLVPDRQRVHRALDPLAQVLGRLLVAMALGGELELAQRLDVEVEGVELRRVVDADLDRPILVGLVPRLVELRLFRDVTDPETAVLDVFLQLVRVGLAAAVLVAVLAAPTGERADAGAAFVVLDVVAVAVPLGIAGLVDKARKLHQVGDLDQHRLEVAHVAVGFDHRPADGVGGGLGLADRPVEQRDAVVAFEIGRVGQDQVRIGHRFRRIGIGIDDVRDHVVAVLVLVGEHADDFRRVHRRVPGHVGHEHEQRVDLVGVARVGVGDHHVHQPVGRERVFPGIGLVDALGGAVLVDQQVLRPHRVAEMRAVERLARRDAGMRFRVRFRRLRIGRLEAEAAGHLDRAEQDLQHVQGAGGLEAVGVR